MAQIPASQALGMFTQSVAAIYKQKPKPKSFLRSFFTEVEKGTRYVSIGVKRFNEGVATDVLRSTEGNRVQMSRSTEKTFDPPFFREYVELTELRAYERLDFSQNIEASALAALAEETAESVEVIIDRFDRAYEKQCAEVFNTGIVTTSSGNIDFKRKAASLVALNGDWTNNAVNPFAHFEAAGNFLRTDGKMQGNTFNVILGNTSLTALFNNQIFQAQADKRNINTINIAMPQLADATGAIYHGRISAGNYKVDLWAYDDRYDVGGVSTPYVDPKKMIAVPSMTDFTLSYAGVPQIVGGQPKRGKYHFAEYMDERRASHIFDVQSAGLAIPTAVDQIYTRIVVA